MSLLMSTQEKELKSMLEYFKRLFYKWVKFTNRYFESIISILIHVFIVVVTICLIRPNSLRMGFEILVYSLSYFFLQLILGYLRAHRGDSESRLIKLKHKRFTEEIKEGFIRTEKSRLPEMIQFVYNVEEIMEDIHEIKK